MVKKVLVLLTLYNLLIIKSTFDVCSFIFILHPGDICLPFFELQLTYYSLSSHQETIVKVINNIFLWREAIVTTENNVLT